MAESRRAFLRTVAGGEISGGGISGSQAEVEADPLWRGDPGPQDYARDTGKQ